MVGSRYCPCTHTHTHTHIYIYYYYKRREKQSKNYVDKHLLVVASALAVDVTTPKLVIDSFKLPNTTLFKISCFIAPGDGGDGGGGGFVIGSFGSMRTKYNEI